MTEGERKMLERIDHRTAEAHSFWHDPIIVGGKTRAWEHDQMAKHWKLGRFSFKAVVWVGAAITGIIVFGTKATEAWAKFTGDG